MGEFGTINGEPGIPMDTEAVMEFLKNGPGGEIEREDNPIPPPPPQVQSRPVNPGVRRQNPPGQPVPPPKRFNRPSSRPVVKSIPREAPRMQAPVQPEPVVEREPVQPEVVEQNEEGGEGPDQELRSAMHLPDERTSEKLKARHGDLKVIPIPYYMEDGKYKTFIMKRLMRAEWEAAEEMAVQIAEKKPGVAQQRILEEKIVAKAIVWPQVPEQEFATLPGGLITTLYGVAQQMACFFNPEAIMQLAFSL